MDRLSLKDIDYVEEILQHPSVRDTVGDDSFTNPLEMAVAYLRNLNYHIVSPHKDTLFLFKKFNHVTYEMHVAIVRGKARKRGILSAYEAAQYLQRETDAKHLITYISSDNLKSLTFAKMCGMRELGTLPGAFILGKQINDMVILGASLQSCLDNGERLWPSS